MQELDFDQLFKKNSIQDIQPLYVVTVDSFNTYKMQSWPLGENTNMKTINKLVTCVQSGATTYGDRK